VTAALRYRVGAALSTVAGVALFAWLIYATGPAAIAENVRRCGAVFVVLLLVSGVRHVLRTVCWYLCIDEDRRGVGFVDLFAIRLVGEALTDLTFAGPLLGESAKAVAMSRRMPAASTLSSIVVENLIYSTAVILFVVSGVAAFVLGVTLPHRMQAVVLLVGVAMLVPPLLVQLALRRRLLVLTKALDALERRNVTVPVLGRRRDAIRDFEAKVHDFFGKRRRLFAVVFVLELLSCLTGVVEAYLILAATAGHASVFAAFVVESANRAVNAVFPFLPLRVGVDEGGAALALNALGYTAQEGVSLAVIRKIRTIAWIGAGLLCMVWYGIGPRAATLAQSTDVDEGTRP
jgi:hypothetical protein